MIHLSVKSGFHLYIHIQHLLEINLNHFNILNFILLNKLLYYIRHK